MVFGASSKSDINLPCMFLNDSRLCCERMVYVGWKQEVRKVERKGDGLRLQR